MKNFITILIILILFILGVLPLSIVTYGGIILIYYTVYNKFEVHLYNTYNSYLGRILSGIRLCFWFFSASCLYYILKSNKFRIQVLIITLPCISIFFGYHINEICKLYLIELLATFFSNILILLILKKIYIKTFFPFFNKNNKEISLIQGTLIFTSFFYISIFFILIQTQSLYNYDLFVFGAVFILQLTIGLINKNKESYTILPFSQTPFSNLLFIKLLLLIGMWILSLSVTIIFEELAINIGISIYPILTLIATIYFIIMLKGEIFETFLEDGLLKKESREKWFQDFNKFYKL